MKHTADIGDHFDDLTVIGQAQPQYNKPRVKLRCICGNEVERFVSDLHKKKMFRKSCGCGRQRYGGRKRAGDKSYEKTGAFNPIAQKFYLGVL